MCCDEGAVLDLPPAVIEMLARYRGWRDEQGFGWGEPDIPDFFRWARFSRLGPVFAEYSASGDWAGAVRAAVGDAVPAGPGPASLTPGAVDQPNVTRTVPALWGGGEVHCPYAGFTSV